MKRCLFALCFVSTSTIQASQIPNLPHVESSGHVISSSPDVLTDELENRYGKTETPEEEDIGDVTELARSILGDDFEATEEEEVNDQQQDKKTHFLRGLLLPPPQLHQFGFNYSNTDNWQQNSPQGQSNSGNFDALDGTSSTTEPITTTEFDSSWVGNSRFFPQQVLNQNPSYGHETTTTQAATHVLPVPIKSEAIIAPGVLEEAKTITSITEPVSYTQPNNQVKDIFEGGSLPIQPSQHVVNNYFQTDNSILTNVDSSAATNQQIVQQNLHVIDQAVQQKSPLAVLKGVNLPEIFDLSVEPSDKDFVWSLLPSARLSNLDRIANLQDTGRLIRALRKASDHYLTVAEEEAINGTQNEDDVQMAKAISDFRASQIIDMLIVVLKKLFLHKIGVITEENVMWTVEYQALLHLSTDWQKWVDQLVTAILNAKV